MPYVVIVQKGDIARAIGPYRSFKAADRDARAWDAYILQVENPKEAPNPWDAYYHEKR